MSISPYNDYLTSTRSQNLLQSLVSESIRMTGINLFFLPKEYITDEIIGEAKSSTYTNLYEIEANILETDYWSGNGDLMTKFGFQSENRATIKISQQKFRSLNIPNRPEPHAGDLFYIPMSGNFMEICEPLNDKPFYQNGILPTFECVCENYKFNDESFNTNNIKIDEIETKYSNENNVTRASNDEIKQAASTIRNESLDSIFNGL